MLSPSNTNVKHSQIIIQNSTPFLAQVDITHLHSLHDPPLTMTQCMSAKLQISAFVANICGTLKFPLRSYGMAMILFDRAILFNSGLLDETTIKDLATCLFVGTKIMDTTKPIRVIISAARDIHKREFNSNILSNVEDQRQRIASFERLLLETCAFDFRIQDAHLAKIKIAKKLNISKKIAFHAVKRELVRE